MGDDEAVIRDVWRRWNEGERDFNPDYIDPEIEILSALTGQVFAGEEGLVRWVAEINEQFETWELAIDEVSQPEPNRLVILGRVRARGRHSGLDLDQPLTWRITMRDGRMLRLENSLGWDGG